MDNLMNKLPEYIRLKYQNTIPVPIISIAKDLGITVYETYDLNRNEAGLIRNEQGNYVIYINARDVTTRKRFTIAHEIGHYLLHKEDLDSQESGFMDYAKQPALPAMHRDADVHLSPEERKKEIEANKFAAQLLMPEKAFKEAFD